jgi:hypothetical protein
LFPYPMFVDVPFMSIMFMLFALRAVIDSS